MLGWLAIGYTGSAGRACLALSPTWGTLSGLLAGMGLGVVIGLANRGQKTKDLSQQI
jgi:hypothetical protein